MNLRLSKNNQSAHPTVQEMREISQNISNRFSLDTYSDSPSLVIVPVDPLHLYAYWNIPDNHKSNNTALVLRIYWHAQGISNITQSRLWFDITLDNNHGQRNIQLPVDGEQYSATIGQRDRHQHLNILIRSNTVATPRAKAKPADQNQDQLPLPQTQNIQLKLPENTTIVDYPKIYDEAKIDHLIRTNTEITHPSKRNNSNAVSPAYGQLYRHYKPDYFDETVIDALIQYNMKEKGRSCYLSPETQQSTHSDSHFAASNASGQNHRR